MPPSENGTGDRDDIRVIVAVLQQQHEQTQATLQRIEGKVDASLSVGHENEKHVLQLDFELGELTRRFEEHAGKLDHTVVVERLSTLEQGFGEWKSALKWSLGVMGTIVGGLVLAGLKFWFGW